MIIKASTFYSTNPKPAHLTTLFIREAQILAKNTLMIVQKERKVGNN